MKDVAVGIGIDATAAMGIAQRVGLNKVRHVEVDILWIQEQQARKLLPLRKSPASRILQICAPKMCPQHWSSNTSGNSRWRSLESELQPLNNSTPYIGRVVATKEKKKQKANKMASPEERCVDSWELSGAGGVWRWQNRTPRRRY